MIYSNIVNEEITRERQMQTLEIIASALIKSFGPMGSHTGIIKDNGGATSVEYTKDGKTIVQNIVFKDPIERSVQDLLTELTRYIVKEVGDGTTSAVLICKNIFKCLCDSNIITNSPADTINNFNGIIKEINRRIESKSKECTLDDIYNIALISTNNNANIASVIKNIYEKYNMNVYIDIGISNTVENIVKEYDGMTLNTGLANTCFINNKVKNSCSIRNPKIYAFKDAIDTPEMLSMLDAILSKNILRACDRGSVYEPVPTVILCEQKITPDASSLLDTIVKLMNGPAGDNIPLLMVSDIHQYDVYEDIIMLTGSPLIKKYLNPDIQAIDIEKGIAPTVENITSFCGTCELVESDQDKTKFIRPEKMFNKDGEYSDIYLSLVNFLERELDKSKNESDGIKKISAIKRRLNSLRGNMIDFLVGGVTMSDREILKASVEDAVLNCSSASKYGVGYGANFMALQTIYEMSTETEYVDNPIIKILYRAYNELCVSLYSSYYDINEATSIVKDSLIKGIPLNIRSNQFDKTVLSSIRSDEVILETINKILTLMFTCNQYLVQSPMHNIYTKSNE